MNKWEKIKMIRRLESDIDAEDLISDEELQTYRKYIMSTKHDQDMKEIAPLVRTIEDREIKTKPQLDFESKDMQEGDIYE